MEEVAGKSTEEPALASLWSQIRSNGVWCLVPGVGGSLFPIFIYFYTQGHSGLSDFGHTPHGEGPDGGAFFLRFGSVLNLATAWQQEKFREPGAI